MTDLAPPVDLEANQGHRLIASNIALIVLPTIFVIGRLLSRAIARAGYWWDDFFVVLALLFSFAPCVCVLISQHSNGFGRHIDAIGTSHTVEFLKILYVYQLFYLSAVTAVKYAMLTFYRRIFPVKQIQILLYAASGVVAIFYIVSMFTSVFQCTPVDHYWLRLKPGHCADGDNVLIVIGAVNCVLDFLIVVLPIPLLWRLRTTTAQKGVLTGIFVCAGFVVVISIIRLVVLGRLTNADVTWNYVDSAIWSAAEPCMGVISACIPSLRPLISLFLRGTVRGLGVSKTGTIKSLGSMSSASGAQGQRYAADNGRNMSIWSHSDHTRFGDDTMRYHEGVIHPQNSRWGHDVEVLGGRNGGHSEPRRQEDEISLEAMNPPPSGVIRVKDEVVITSSDWLEYKDKVY